MLRFLMAAMLFLGSANGEELNMLNFAFPGVSQKNRKCTCYKLHKCKPPKRGPQGHRGPPGPNGLNGATGPTGPAGPPSGDSILRFASGDQYLRFDANPSDAITLTFNDTGFVFPPLQIVNGVIIQPDFINDISFNISEDRVIISIIASFTYARDLYTNPPGIQMYMKAAIWVASPEDPTTFVPSGVEVDFPPFTTPESPPNVQFISTAPTPFNIPIRGGSRLIMVLTMTSSEPLPSPILGTASAGICL